MRGFFSWISPWLLGGIAALALQADEARLLRFPSLNGNRVVFTYAGDLYTVSALGGVARRLTSDPKGFEMFARFSPDGKTLAFTGQYDGNTEVYVMPSEGGEPRRLTHTATLERDDVSDRMGPNNIVMAWKDNETVVYRSRRNHWNPFKGELTLARLSGGVPETLPVPRGGWCSFSPDGRQMAYNRVFREFRTWKRYRGGQADEIWLHDFGTGQTTRLTTDPAQDIFPMWHGDKMYFVSEREESHQANLYVMDMKTRKPRRLTEFTEFAVKFPSMGDTGIVFENGGYLYRLDFQTEKAVRIPVEIHEDMAIGRGGLRDVSKEITTYEIAPDGARGLIGARGDVFTVPAKNGAARNLTQSPGVHERNAVWSPDGKWIGYVSDQSGGDEVWIRPQEGSGEPRALTSGADTYKYEIAWSPDSKRIAWTDKLNRLQFVEVESKLVTQVAQSDAFEIRDFVWSPDGQWLAFTQPEVRRFANIYLYGLAQKNQVQVTDGWFDVGSPEFSSDGKYLFFISERSFNPSYGQTEWNHTYSDMERIYLVTLAAATKSPLAPKSDEVKPRDDKAAVSGTEAKAASDKDKDKDGDVAKAAKPSKVVVSVDVEGLTQRIIVLPPSASNYGSLSSVGDKLFYVKKGKLHLFDLEKEKETELGEAAGFRVSADRKKMLVKVGSDLAILDLPSAKLDLTDRKLSLSDLKVRLDRRAEWNQIYNECWRQMRDFLFDPKLHGVDWAGMRRRYEPLLAHVQHRADLTFIIGEMIGELNIGHAYVGGGDLPKPERIPLGLLGAVIQPDASGYFRIERILRGHNWDSKYRSPLTEIGVEIRPGDYILAVQGQSTRSMTDLYSALVGTAGKPVVLRVNREPKEEGARDQTVIPTADEHPLYYLDWVLGNIDKVDKASGGKIGYVHIPDMGVPGLNEFAKFYYPQLHKEALVVDCRGNGGGNVSPMIIERLRREPAMWTVARNGAVNVDPSGQVLGPKVLLIDQHSASDGDIVGYRFRKHRLGPIIGQRSWGGVVGIRGSLPLLDGGILNRPEFSRFDLEAKEWIMEGTGVEPDIEVDNDPTREFSGIDDQLNRAIAELKKAMEAKPVKIPQPPAYPDKSK
ncbi:MAG: PDZ domain-containing protein [Verrucomicrobia bacterium]|nr:PDZ domain-containing protein [Verrucomicrobiota bacterium]